MNIIELAFGMAARVQHFFGRVKSFYYSVVLLAYRCGQCNGRLSMISESRCRCIKCGIEFDPTVEFQRCSVCGGVPVLRVRRYYCGTCGSEVISKFVFETLPFEKEYFKQKMAESRQRKNEKLQQVREMLLQCRSQSIIPEAVDLDSVPGLLAALNGLTAGIDEQMLIELKGKFDLGRYQRHIKAHLEDFEIDLRGIPAIIENARKDLIWRFIAVIFLEHQQEVEIRQEGQTIWVSKYVDRQGQDFSDRIEETDGFEGIAC
ncbi:MAG: hypothetical protein PHP01_03330 [Phycisphaerae bacterium]|nr:hypothetical protein [Phycisphaerae bacterium]